MCKKPRANRYLNTAKTGTDQEDPQTMGKTANHLTEADHTEAQAEAPHTDSQGHLITTERTGGALHHKYTRLATFYSQLQNLMKQKAN